MPIQPQYARNDLLLRNYLGKVIRPPIEPKAEGLPEREMNAPPESSIPRTVIIERLVEALHEVKSLSKGRIFDVGKTDDDTLAAETLEALVPDERLTESNEALKHIEESCALYGSFISNTGAAYKEYAVEKVRDMTRNVFKTWLDSNKSLRDVIGEEVGTTMRAINPQTHYTLLNLADAEVSMQKGADTVENQIKENQLKASQIKASKPELSLEEQRALDGAVKDALEDVTDDASRKQEVNSSGLKQSIRRILKEVGKEVEKDREIER